MFSRTISSVLCSGLLMLAATSSAFASDPVPGIDVKLGTNPGGQLVARQQTDARGSATFANVQAGSYRVSVRAAADKAICSTVRAGTDAPKMTSSTNGTAVTTLTLRTPSSIQVSVENNGAAHAGSLRTIINTSRSNIKHDRSMQTPRSCGPQVPL
jgi:hypothetical protein